MSKNSKLMKKYVKQINTITSVEYEREALMRIFKVAGPILITYLYDLTLTNVCDNNAYIISDGLIKYLIHLLEKKEVNIYIKDVIYCRNTLAKLNFQYNINEWLTPMLNKVSTMEDDWYIICKIFNGSFRQIIFLYVGDIYGRLRIKDSYKVEQIIAKYGFICILNEQNRLHYLYNDTENIGMYTYHGFSTEKLYYRVEHTTLKNMCINVILENNVNVEEIPTPLLWYE